MLPQLFAYMFPLLHVYTENEIPLVPISIFFNMRLVSNAIFIHSLSMIIIMHRVSKKI